MHPPNYTHCRNEIFRPYENAYSRQNWHFDYQEMRGKLPSVLNTRSQLNLSSFSYYFYLPLQLYKAGINKFRLSPSQHFQDYKSNYSFLQAIPLFFSFLLSFLVPGLCLQVTVDQYTPWISGLFSIYNRSELPSTYYATELPIWVTAIYLISD